MSTIKQFIQQCLAFIFSVHLSTHVALEIINTADGFPCALKVHTLKILLIFQLTYRVEIWHVTVNQEAAVSDVNSLCWFQAGRVTQAQMKRRTSAVAIRVGCVLRKGNKFI